MHRCSSRLSLLAGAAVAALAACADDPVGACATDADCAALAEEGAVPTTDHRCHPLDHVCYPGCTTDAECQGLAFRPGLRCNVEGHCMPGSASDGASDSDSDGDGGAGDAGCEAGSCPPCNSCGEAGVCVPLPAGEAPPGDCPGDEGCGAGQCDGQGSCAYASQGFVCAESCAAGQHLRQECDDGHACVTVVDEACAPYACDAAGQSCQDGCRDHGDCVSSSLCDRSEAHIDGTGSCVASAAIVTVDGASYPTIAAAITAALADGNKTHVALPPDEYAETIAVAAAGEVAVVGLGDGPGGVTVRASGSDQPAVSVAGGATVLLQNLTLTDATDGVKCLGAGSRVALIEALATGNDDQGVDAYECDVTVRRSMIFENDKGGLSLTGGDFTLVNDVIVRNGGAGSDVGGVYLAQMGTVVFFHNTLTSNQAKGGVPAGIVCAVTPPASLKNNIVWGDTGDGEVSADCALDNSNVAGGAPAGGAGNLDLNPQFANPSAEEPVAEDFRIATTTECVDGGAQVPPSVTVIDFSGGPRKLGDHADMGAFEVQ